MLKRRTRIALREVRGTKQGDVPFHIYTRLSSVSLSLTTLSQGGKTTGFYTWGKHFELNFFIRKAFLQIFKLGRQNHSHSRLICAMQALLETLLWFYFCRHLPLFTRVLTVGEAGDIFIRISAASFLFSSLVASAIIIRLSFSRAACSILATLSCERFTN